MHVMCYGAGSGEGLQLLCIPVRRIYRHANGVFLDENIVISDVAIEWWVRLALEALSGSNGRPREHYLESSLTETVAARIHAAINERMVECDDTPCRRLHAKHTNNAPFSSYSHRRSEEVTRMVKGHRT